MYFIEMHLNLDANVRFRTVGLQTPFRVLNKATLHLTEVNLAFQLESRIFHRKTGMRRFESELLENQTSPPEAAN